MTNYSHFVAAALLLLLTPGPTNSLIAAGGALDGWRRALPLIGAEILGYACAIAVLELLLAPFVDAFHPVRFALQLACAAYLAFAAWKIWVTAQGSARAVTFRRVFLATLSNPKAAVFVFVILPPRSVGIANVLHPYVSTLFLLIPLAGSAWLAAGAAMHAHVAVRGEQVIRRASSLLLAGFSSLLVFALFGVTW